MLRLNLMPWRERQRLRALRHLRMKLLGSVLLALCTVVLIDQLARKRAEQQLLSNASLQAELTALDNQLEQLVEARRATEVARSQTASLERLRADQRVLSALFADLERALPVGTQLTELKLENGRLQMVGVAASGAMVAQLMRDLERSSVLLGLELKRMKSVPGGDEFLLEAHVAAAWS